jgi:hypothetical protein
MKNELINKLILAINDAQKGSELRNELYTDPSAAGANEYLFFIKPEITIPSDRIDLEKIFSLVFDKIKEYNFQIKNLIVLPAVYLKEHNIIAKHYGVINAIAGNALQNLNAGSKDNFKIQFNIEIEKAKVFGGIEFIDTYPAFTPKALDYMWQNSPTIKLGGGAYCQSLSLDGEKIYLVNGFHPRQLEHFIVPGRSIVAFTLTADTDWKTARNSFIGKTNPAEASDSSIRRMLLDNKEFYGLSTVNSSWNGVHLSAGPVEALVELIRYNSDFDSGNILMVQDYKFGKELAASFAPGIVNRILSNEQVVYNNKTITIFDLTEEMNSSEALEILKKVYRN